MVALGNASLGRVIHHGYSIAMRNSPVIVDEVWEMIMRGRALQRRRIGEFFSGDTLISSGNGFWM